MLVIAVTMLFSKSYSQNNIQVKVINGDTLFVFNKEYNIVDNNLYLDEERVLNITEEQSQLELKQNE